MIAVRERAREIVLALNGGKATTAQMELLQLELVRVERETVEAIIACLEDHSCVSTCCDYQKPGSDIEVIDAIKKHFRP